MRLTESEIRAAHRLHREAGLSIRELARRLTDAGRFPSFDSAEASIRRAFKRRGLPRRPAAEAAALANRTHGRAQADRKAYQRDYFAARRRRPRCEALLSDTDGRRGRRRGDRCRLFVRKGVEGARFCRHHEARA